MADEARAAAPAEPKSALDKTSSAKEAVSQIQPGDVVMICGFQGVGLPSSLIAEVVDQRVDDLTVITNDIHSLDRGIGSMSSANLISRVIASSVGADPALQRKIEAGDLQIEIVPQGTLIERIRCGGGGLGGFLTPTGIGTAMAVDKRIIEVEDEAYLLETPLTADVALISAFRGDRWGNLSYRGTSRNLNPVMATAAGIVIAEVGELYDIGDLDPDLVDTPGIFVDMVVEAS